MKISIGKDAAHDMSSEKCKIKEDTTAHLSEWPKSRTLTTPNAYQDVDQQELLIILLTEMQNGTVTWEDSLTVSYKTKYTLTIQSSNSAPSL